jgi:predicted GIY-YIG superfamily endonuclease
MAVTESEGIPVNAEVDVVQQVTDMQALYRMFDSSGRLIYVGVTGNLGRRLGNHSEKLWFPRVMTIKLQWFFTRAEALAAERQAIQTEMPLVNIAGAGPLPLQARQAPPRCIVGELPDGPITLAIAVGLGVIHCALAAARRASSRPGFPEPVGERGTAHLYDIGDLLSWQAGKVKVSR